MEMYESDYNGEITVYTVKAGERGNLLDSLGEYWRKSWPNLYRWVADPDAIAVVPVKEDGSGFVAHEIWIKWPDSEEV